MDYEEKDNKENIENNEHAEKEYALHEESSDHSHEEKTESDDVHATEENASTESWSQVSAAKSKIWFLDTRLWIIGGICLIVLFMMIFSGHKKHDSKNQNKVDVTQSDNSELAQNLAKLSSMTSEIQQDQKTLAAKNALLMNPNDSINNGVLNGNNLVSEKQQKELTARQNAPTSMFSIGRNGAAMASQNPTQASNTNANATGQSSPTFAGQGTYTSFANQSMTATAVQAKKIAHPTTTVASGEFLHAVLETAIDSDLPGEVRAVVSEPVYAYVGETPLIPAGSRLIGQYSSSVTQGQDRVFVVWNRVILPNGTSAQINSPGTDQLGMAGQAADDVNTHFFARFGEASLLSIIGAGAANAGVSTNDQYNSAAQYRMAIAQSFQQSADGSLQNSLPTKPTLMIDQGAEINVFVAHDIDFYNVMKAG